ncbi:hypothetical protein M434DRAFT_10995 [Hypoxylon sp. CO27-5]|nr:hypothetical protein M434DRAFT_10995 [Hypoxylon sp. CO27-5]
MALRQRLGRRLRPLPNPPQLPNYLPQEGFTWRTRHQTLFLRDTEARQIELGLLQADYPFNDNALLQYINDLFSEACTWVQLCEFMRPVRFWQFIGTRLPWARFLTGADLLDFANRIICARLRYLIDFRAWELHHEIYSIEIPNSHRHEQHNAANVATDRWTLLILRSSPHPGYRNYFQWWFRHERSEGSLTQILARFRAERIMRRRHR